MTAAATALNNVLDALGVAQAMVFDALNGLLSWARAIPQDVWIIASFSLLGLTLIVTGIAITNAARHRAQRAQAPALSPTDTAKDTALSETQAAEIQAALAQAFDVNEHHQEQIETLKADLDHWAKALLTDRADALADAELSAMKQALAQSHRLVQDLHQTAKTQQLSTINQTLSETGARLDEASKGVLETMADWLEHHQTLFDQLNAFNAPLQTLEARQESPGSVRHAATLEHIDALSRTLNGLERSLQGLGQDLARIEKLMLGDR